MALFVRLDDRLLHSEVLYYCLPTIQPSHLIVASRLPQLAMMEASVGPADVPIALVDPTEVVEQVHPERRTLVVFGTLLDLKVSREAGFAPSTLLLANRTHKGTAIRLRPGYDLDDRELASLKEVLEDGLEVHSQRWPNSDIELVTLDSLKALPGQHGTKDEDPE